MRRIRSRPKRIPNSSNERNCPSARASLQRDSAGVLLAGSFRRLHRLGHARRAPQAFGVLAQVVDEHRAQRLAELTVSAVDRIR